jgi:hypothetical protein
LFFICFIYKFKKQYYTMSTIKEALKLRNGLVQYVRDYMFNTNSTIPVVLKKEIDLVIYEGAALIEDIDFMFWTDSNYIDMIISYLKNSETGVTKLGAFADFPHLSDLLFCLETQRSIFEKIINEQTSNPENKKVGISTNRFPVFMTPTSITEFN